MAAEIDAEDRLPTLLAYARTVGIGYGMEDLPLFVYSLLRMQRSRHIIDLGTGSGTMALWCAAAVAENGEGSVNSYDDGSQWSRFVDRAPLGRFGWTTHTSRLDFMRGFAERLGVADKISFHETAFPPFPKSANPPDCVIVDFQHDPVMVIALLTEYLPQVASVANIFIDGASTSHKSFLVLERVIAYLNAGKIPRALEPDSETVRRVWLPLIAMRSFSLVHLTRPHRLTQNSTAWLRVEPIDHVPHPIAAMY